MTSSAKWQREYRREKASRGLCMSCKEPRMENPKRPGQFFSLCRKHKSESLPRDSAFHARRSAEWEKLGICVSCGQRPSIKATIPEQTDKRCGVCVEQQADSKARRRAEKMDARRAGAWASMLLELRRVNIENDLLRSAN